MAVGRFDANGFGVSEAAYFGKTLFLVPVKNHVEQRINALDAAKMGWSTPIPPSIWIALPNSRPNSKRSVQTMA